MSYTPSDLRTGTVTPFFLAYNSATYGPMNQRITYNVPIDTCAQQDTVTITSGAIDNASNDTLVAKSDMIFTTNNSANRWSMHLNLHSPANPTATSQSPSAPGTTTINAFQDHPARTQYHAFIGDEVLSVNGTSSLSLQLTAATPNSLTPDCTLPAQRGVIVGCFL